MLPRHACTCFVVLALAAATARADEVRLKDDTFLYGTKITETDQTIVFRVMVGGSVRPPAIRHDGKRMEIRKDTIKEIYVPGLRSVGDYKADRQLSAHVVSLLAAAVEEGTGLEQVSRLRELVVQALAEEYRRAASGAGHLTWRAGSFDDFWKWLESQEELFPELILAIHPRDKVEQVFLRVDRLHAEFQQACTKWPHLVIAYAVVWDGGLRDPDGLIKLHLGYTKHGLFDQSPGAGMLESFRHITTTQNQLTFRSESFTWPFLVYVVDNPVTVEQRQWALRQFQAQRQNLGPVYSQIPYDSAAARRYDVNKWDGQVLKPAQRPRTLQNMMKYGGVCSHQALFASRVCKAFGVPAFRASARNLSGTPHAFVGYFEAVPAGNQTQPAFRYHGRYRGDHYYVGKVRDPQTGEHVTDRELELRFAGAADYEDYERARLLWRVARWVNGSNPELATRLFQASIEHSKYFAPAWLSTAERLGDRLIAPSESIPILRAMLADLKQHPDLTFKVLEQFLTAIPEENVDERNKYYERAYDLYKGRADLQARLRLAQGTYLAAQGRTSDALKAMGRTAIAIADETWYVFALAMETLRLFAREKRYTTGIRFAEAVLAKMPYRRGNAPAFAYIHFCRATARFCKMASNSVRAAKWHKRAEKLESMRMKYYRTRRYVPPSEPEQDR